MGIIVQHQPRTGLIKPDFGSQLDSTHSLARDLAGAWLFNEGEGDMVYDSSFGPRKGPLHGTITGATWVRTPVGTALSFNGIGDGITFTDAPIDDWQTGVTVAVWVSGVTVSQFDTYLYMAQLADQNRFLVMRNSQYSPLNRPSFYCGRRFNANSVQTTASAVGPELFLFVGTVDAVDSKNTINGLVEDIDNTPSVSLPNLSTYDTFTIGHKNGIDNFLGTLHAVMMWTRKFSPPDITMLYQNAWAAYSVPRYYSFASSAQASTFKPYYAHNSQLTGVS